MEWLIIAGITISSSIDNLGVGISYGIRNIRVGIISNLLIAAVCFLFSFSGIDFGKWISSILPGVLPFLLSAFILIVVGIRIILLSLPRRKQYSNVEIKNSNGIRMILQNPEYVDFDRSNSIGIGESIILGIALSANALTNGVSAGLMGISPLIISLFSAAGSFITVWAGVWLGRKTANIRIGSFTLGQFGTLLSGIILMLIAINYFL
jgi:putative sporulation protein YtaF